MIPRTWLTFPNSSNVSGFLLRFVWTAGRQRIASSDWICQCEPPLVQRPERDQLSAIPGCRQISELAGHLRLLLEFGRRLKLQRLSSQSAQADVERRSIRHQLYLLKVARLHFGRSSSGTSSTCLTWFASTPRESEPQ